MMRLLSLLVFVIAAIALYKGAQLLLIKERNQGVWRAAYAISGFWLGIPFLIIWAQESWRLDHIDQEAWVAWVLLAVVPNALFWVMIWVLRGFEKP